MDNSGPAFPDISQIIGEDCSYSTRGATGLTKRELAAMLVMGSLAPVMVAPSNSIPPWAYLDYARTAVRAADALLAELAKEQP